MVAAPAARWLEVDALGVEESSAAIRLCGSVLRLRVFQEEVLREARAAALGRGPRLVALEAPTGAGKTLTLLAPLLASASPRGALGVYPSRELARDQMESIASLLESAGCAEAGGEPSGLHAAYRVSLEGPYGGLDTVLHLVRITSDTLEELIEARGFRSRGEALDSVREAILRGLYRGEPAIVFTVPEYPYLLLEAAYRDFESAGGFLSTVLEEAMRRGIEGLLDARGLPLLYRKEALEYFARYAALAGSAVFLDEFHAYGPREAAAVAALAAAMLAEHRSHGLLVVSSATPSAEVLSLLQRLAGRLAGVARVEAGTCSPGAPGCAVVRRRTLLGLLGFEVRATGAAGYALAQWAVAEHVADFLELAGERLRAACGSTWRKAMIIVDRVALVYRIAGELGRRGYRGIACVTGLRRLHGGGAVACDAESPREARIIVGNEAISYGIDVPEVDVGVIYSRDAAQALQRIGRVGRRSHPAGCPAVVMLVLPGYALRGAPARGRLGYHDLPGLLGSLLPGLPAPLRGVEERLAEPKAAAFLTAYLYAKLKASGMYGFSDEELNRIVEGLVEPAREALRSASGLYPGRYAVGGAALYRALGLRGGLAATLCWGGAKADYDLLTAARNARLSHDPGNHCLRVEAVEPLLYPALRASRSGWERLAEASGSIVPLGLVADALGDPLLVQVGRSEPRGEPVEGLRRLLESGALDPQQPVLVLAGISGDVAEAAAALGLGLPVAEPTRGDILGLLVPV